MTISCLLWVFFHESFIQKWSLSLKDSEKKKKKKSVKSNTFVVEKDGVDSRLEEYMNSFSVTRTTWAATTTTTAGHSIFLSLPSFSFHPEEKMTNE
jgi:hypothetical protein